MFSVKCGKLRRSKLALIFDVAQTKINTISEIIMPFIPKTIQANSFHQAWTEVVSTLLVAPNNELRNLVVHIRDPTIFCEQFTERLKLLTESCDILNPKQVAYTIFPHKLLNRYPDNPEGFYNAYNKDNGLYEKLERIKKSKWGTYFRRMTCYPDDEKVNTVTCENNVNTNQLTGAETFKEQSILANENDPNTNQLNKAIQSMKRNRSYKAAHTIFIQKPSDASFLRGGPCLNYIAFQCVNTTNEHLLGMLAVYRKHDFLVRAYGNYWGLCNLQKFVAEQVNRRCGPLTCISSHAYIPDGHRRKLKTFLRECQEDEHDENEQ